MKYQAVEIPNPSAPNGYNFYGDLKRKLMSVGYGYKKNYREAKAVSAIKYWWRPYTINIVGGTSVTLPGGKFYAYVYTYPEYKTNKKTITKEDSRSKEFYDDSIDDVLGGVVQKLGG